MLNSAAYIGKVPEYTLESLVAYARTGRPTGGFLAAYLSGDLFRALNAADGSNWSAFTEIGRFIWNELPMGCWGSPEQVSDWIGHRGLEGVA